jgi:Tol biopolymer transport system component
LPAISVESKSDVQAEHESTPFAIGEVHRVVPSAPQQMEQRLSTDGQNVAFVRRAGASTSLAEQATRQTSLAGQATRQTSLAGQATRQTSLAGQATRQTSSTLVLRGLDGGIERELVTQPGIHGLAWSPDSKAVAYAQALPAQSCQIWVIDTRVGAHRKVGQCAFAERSQISWSANGAELYFQDQRALHRPTHIAAFNIETGATRVLTNPTTGSGDMLPTPSSDGKTLVFLREDAWLSGHVYLLDLNQGSLQRLTQSASDIYGIAWEPKGNGLLVSSNWGGDIGMWRIDVKPSDGSPMRRHDKQVSPTRRHGRQVRRLGGAGVNYGYLASSQSSGRLSFEVRQMRSNLVRLQGHGENTEFAPYVQVSAKADDPPMDRRSTLMSEFDAASLTRDADPDFDPVHEQLVFVSWRTGRPQLWVDPTSGNPRQLSSGSFDYLGGPRWSPDGAQIVAARSHNTQQDIVLFDVARARETQLTQDQALDFAPQWSSFLAIEKAI